MSHIEIRAQEFCRGRKAKCLAGIAKRLTRAVKGHVQRYGFCHALNGQVARDEARGVSRQFYIS